MTKGLSVDELKDFMPEAFAPMILSMNIEPCEITASGARFLVPSSEFIMRTGDIICGQALASIADTVGVMALFAHNEERRFMTTVDMTTHFMRPLPLGDIDVVAEIVSNGRRMAVVRVEALAKGQTKPAASSTCAYIYV